jgi:ubiquinol-cytochrome c reductase iron-sulfur subunit
MYTFDKSSNQECTMSVNEIDDQGRRRFLVVATSVVGAGAVAGMTVPFVASWFPSERAKAAGAPVEFDISKMETGEQVVVEWRGKPVWVVKRSKDMLANLVKIEPQLLDPQSTGGEQPEYCKNRTRSIKPEVLVAVGVCTHLGCSPTYRPELAAADLGSHWLGGFYCPCHGSKFDLSARVFKGVPAPTNIVIPPHKYLSDTHILIGEDA